MKILFVLDKPNLYGSEQHVLKLMKLLKDDYAVSLLAFDDGPLLTILKDENISFSILKVKWLSIKQLLNLFHFFNKNNFDIIHSHQPKAMFWTTIISKFVSIPSVITIHSLPSTNMQTYRNVMLKIAVGLFHHFIKFVSELLAKKAIYLSQFSYGYAQFKHKAVIIPNWIDQVHTTEQVKRTFSSEVRLISVGSVTFNKGMDRLVASLALIKNESWNLKILGDYTPAYKRQLMNFTDRAGISDRIEFTGHVTNVHQLMLDSDGFILLSRGETFGLVYIEAMNCGLPVIAWDIPVIKEILPPGNVVMSNLNDIKKVFKEIYSSLENYQKLSLRNSDFVKANFTSDKVYLKYRILYDQVLSDSMH